MRALSGFTLLEALLAMQLLAVALIIQSKVMIVNMARQQEVKQHRIAILSLYSAWALSALPRSDQRWHLWQEQLKQHVPGASLRDQEGGLDICWQESCLLAGSLT